MPCKGMEEFCGIASSQFKSTQPTKTYRNNDHSGKAILWDGTINGGIVHLLERAGNGHVSHHIGVDGGVVHFPCSHNNSNVVGNPCQTEKGTEHIGCFHGHHVVACLI